MESQRIVLKLTRPTADNISAVIVNVPLSYANKLLKDNGAPVEAFQRLKNAVSHNQVFTWVLHTARGSYVVTGRAARQYQKGRNIYFTKSK